MKVLVVSDSHGKTETLKKIEKKEKADYYFHCGDSCDDAYSIEPFMSVKGNCDLFHYDREIILKLEGVRFFITHGHLYTDLMLKYKAIENQINIVLIGHTHMPMHLVDDNILFVNPGSVAKPRGGSKASYAILEIPKGKFDASKVEVTFKSIE